MMLLLFGVVNLVGFRIFYKNKLILVQYLIKNTKSAPENLAVQAAAHTALFCPQNCEFPYSDTLLNISPS